MFLRTDTTLPPFYVLVYVDSLVFATADTEALAHVKSELQKRYTCTDLAPPSDESVEPSSPYPELVGCLMYLITCTRPDLAYPLSLLARFVALGRHRKVHWDAAKRVLRYLCSTSGMGLVLGGRARVVLIGHADASWVDDLATQRSSQGYTFSLGSGSVSWRSTRSSSVLSSSCETEIYAGAMAAQELRCLTYLLTDLGEAPRSPPVLYVDNKAMLALCQEQRLEHRTKHIALRYFLARELQQRGQLRLAYVASQANTADVFTKALQPCDHQRFCTVLGLVLFTVLFVLLYITLHVNWPYGHLLVLRLRGDFVIHPELALPFLTGLVTSCFLYVPTCFLVQSFIRSHSNKPLRRPQPCRPLLRRPLPMQPATAPPTCCSLCAARCCRAPLASARVSPAAARAPPASARAVPASARAPPAVAHYCPCTTHYSLCTRCRLAPTHMPPAAACYRAALPATVLRCAIQLVPPPCALCCHQT
ncbi:unnamed protein product [Closterium sp. NIES-54]